MRVYIPGKLTMLLSTTLNYTGVPGLCSFNWSVWMQFSQDSDYGAMQEANIL